MNNQLIVIVLFLLGMQACKKEVDQTAPTLSIVSSTPSLTTDTICGQVATNKVLRVASGETLSINTQMSDNEQLSQYKIDIHNNFDCHGHRSPRTTVWNLQEVFELSGNETTETIEVKVPNDVAAGNYHFYIRLVDLSGNEAPVTYYTLVVTNTQDTIDPQLDFTPPSGAVAQGGTLSLTGTVSDDQDLAEGKLELVYFTLSGNRSLAKTQPFDASVGTNHSFTLEYTIPNTLPKGNYDFRLYAYDAVGNRVQSEDFGVTIN